MSQRDGHTEQVDHEAKVHKWDVRSFVPSSSSRSRSSFSSSFSSATSRATGSISSSTSSSAVTFVDHPLQHEVEQPGYKPREHEERGEVRAAEARRVEASESQRVR